MKRLAANAVYDLLLQHAAAASQVEKVLIGLTWTALQTEAGSGLAMTLGAANRSLPWSGSLRGRAVAALAPWLLSWNPWEASVGMACVNAAVNPAALPLLAPQLHLAAGGNLAVFEYFLPRLKDCEIAVIGRYPGLEQYEATHRLHVIERLHAANDYPDPACEFLLPNMDWVFLTASSLSNKTFPRLAELCRDANLVLMGPGTPWLPELAEFGVDFLAGVSIEEPAALYEIIGEAGGTRIFDSAVQYRVMDLRQGEMADLRQRIAALFGRRQTLQQSLAQGSPLQRNALRELERVDNELSDLDSRYRKLWQGRARFAHWAADGLPHKA